MTKRAAMLLVAAAIVAVGIYACGGDDQNAPEGTATPTDVAEQAVFIPWGPESIDKSEYVRRANRVCEESWTRMLDSFAQRYGGTETGQAFAEATRNIFLPSIQFWFDDISYLEAPPGEKPQVEEMLIALQLAVFEGEQQRPVSSPRQLAVIFADSNRLVSQRGLDSCIVEDTSFASS